MTKFRYLALAGALAAFGAVAPANAALTVNAITLNAITLNAITLNALVANGLLNTGPALGDLNGVTIEAVSTVHR